MSQLLQASREPIKLTISRLDDPSQQFVAQFNPSTLQERIEARYASVPIPGLGHEPLQYVHTSSLEISFELFFKAENEAEVDMVDASRRFLHSLMSPRRAAILPGGAPPPVLFNHLNVFSIVGVVTDLTASIE